MVYLATTTDTATVSLNQILKIIGLDLVENLYWLVNDIEVSEAIYPEFWELWGKRADVGVFITGSMFCELSVQAAQIIEGIFVGYRKHKPMKAWQHSSFSDPDALILIEFIDGQRINILFKSEKISSYFRDSEVYRLKELTDFLNEDY